MKQKYILVFFVSFILIITLISFFVLSNEKSKNTNNLQHDKINSKIFYLDETILNISNNINNIYLNVFVVLFAVLFAIYINKDSFDIIFKLFAKKLKRS